MGILQVFYEPGKLFSSLEKRRAAWVLPLIVILLLSLASTLVAVNRIGMESIMRQQVENSSRLTPEQQQQQMNIANAPWIIYVVVGQVLIAVPIVILVMAGILTLFALIGSKQPKFSTNFSMVTFAYLPYSVLTAIMSILVVMIAQDPASLDIRNLLSTNVAAFMDKETTSKFLYSFLGSIDVLSFFEIGLLSYGFSKVNRTTMSFALGSVFFLWFIYVLGKSGLAILF
jgi:hypothetical protein